MSGSATIRVGVVGAGQNTRTRHIPELKSIDGVEVVAVANRTLASSRAVADEFDIEGVFDDWETLVQDSGVDAVVVGTWPNMHSPVTLAALFAGKHVLCEARMAMSSAEARQMLEAAEDRPELVAQLVPSPLSFGVDQTVRRIVSEGSLGSIFAVDIQFRSGAFAEPDRPPHWREERAKSGNNIMAIGIWYETLMRWLGTADSVFALSRTAVPLRPSPDGPVEVEIPDYLEVLAEMSQGALARFQMSDVTGLSRANRATLYGTEGTLRFEDGELYFGEDGGEDLARLEIPESERGKWRVERDFIDAIRGRAEVELTDFATGVRYMEFTDAIWLSMEQGRLVGLPLTPSTANTFEQQEGN